MQNMLSSCKATASIASREASRASYLDVLSAVFQLTAALYRPPGAELLSDFESGRLDALLAALAETQGLEPPVLRFSDWPEAQARYVALFVTNPAGLPAPPYAGYALDGELLGPSVQELKALYAAQGLELSADWHDLPDHIAALAEAGLLLLEAGRPEAALELLEHFLLPWFRHSVSSLQEHDASGFYGPLTSFLLTAMEAVKLLSTATTEVSGEVST